MNIKRIAFLSFLVFYIFQFTQLLAQSDSLKTANQQIKKGFSFGGVPALAFDSDLGFRYGLVLNLYHYGDGSTYPDYKHSLYLEWSRTTKGSGNNMLIYDSKYLIPKVRFTGEVSYLTEQALDFYGVNGYEAFYNKTIEDNYSRLFYRMDRKLLKVKTDFMGKITNNHLLWYAGLAHFGVKTDTVDIHKLNEGKSTSEKLPYIGGGLYQQFIDNGNIPKNEQYGGNTQMLRFGLVFDNRDSEACPGKGIFADAQVILAPGFIGNETSYSRMALTFRQYVPIIYRKLSFSYRFSYQKLLTGRTPFYMLPFVMNMAPAADRDGLGGAKTLRGILRNRVVGEDFAVANFELRYKFLQKIIFKQNLSLTIAPFFDSGRVLKNYNLKNSANYPQSFGDYDFTEKLHNSCGAGLYTALNENFIIAISYGRAIDKRDGVQGVYINIGYIF